jgi:hypothetical protein
MKVGLDFNRKFYGQWSPPVDQVLFENYFKDKRNGFFIKAMQENPYQACLGGG